MVSVMKGSIFFAGFFSAQEPTEACFFPAFVLVLCWDICYNDTITA